MGNIGAKLCGGCQIIPFSTTDVPHGGRGTSESVLHVLSQLEKEQPRQLSHAELKKCTSGFSQQNLIGSGGFGDVYKGQLPRGVPIAVKVLNVRQGKDATKKAFIAEVSTIGKTYHRNVVKLCGFCYNAGMIALVYEFVENGSLDKILFENRLNLEFDHLFLIATEIAKGISYLHNDCDKRIIHYDIKPANVLIDLNLCPKVADFGLAKLCNMDSSHVTLTNGRGTRGYTAPELRSDSTVKVTYKCDVYSFGVMLFEFLRRKRNMGGDQEWFPDRVWRKFKQGQLDAVLAECGIEDKNRVKAKRLSMVALMCAQYEPKDRPSMTTVVEILEGKIGYESERKIIISSKKAPSGFSSETSNTSDGYFTARNSAFDARHVQSHSTTEMSTVEVEKIDNVKKKKGVTTVVLKAHCESCAQKVQNYIERMEGVQSADVDLENSHITVKGTIDEEELVQYVQKRLNKPAEIPKVEVETSGEENIAVKSSAGKTKADKRRDDKQPNKLAEEWEISLGEIETEPKMKPKKKLERRGNIRAPRTKVMWNVTEEEKANVDTDEKKEKQEEAVTVKTRSRKGKEPMVATTSTNEGNEKYRKVSAKSGAAKSKHGLKINELKAERGEETESEEANPRI